MSWMRGCCGQRDTTVEGELQVVEPVTEGLAFKDPVNSPKALSTRAGPGGGGRSCLPCRNESQDESTDLWVVSPTGNWQTQFPPGTTMRRSVLPSVPQIGGLTMLQPKQAYGVTGFNPNRMGFVDSKSNSKEWSVGSNVAMGSRAKPKVEEEKEMTINYRQDGPITPRDIEKAQTISYQPLLNGSPFPGTPKLDLSDIRGDGTRTPVNPQHNDPINVYRDPKLLTPRQKRVLDEIYLPNLPVYPKCPGSEEVSIDGQRRDLESMFKGFVFDLYNGTYLTQLTTIKEKQLIHCQLIDRNRILALHQGSGRIIEFPLVSISRIYRITNAPDKNDLNSKASHIIILEFLEKKLAFLFHDTLASQRFLVCMELLVRKTQENSR